MDSTELQEQFSKIHALSKYDTEFSEKCIYLSQAINQKITTIHTIVENLGSLLTNPSPEKRELGTLVLSQILENLPNDFLSSTELHFISSFYTDRLKDQHQVIPAVLRGILALVQMNNLPEGAPHKLLNALFENVACQQQQLKDRQCIYQIFKEFLSRRLTEIQAMGLDFVLGVIQAMDGERDPRNLLLLFNWIPQFLQSVKLGHLTEEMFDIIACYFPIDFRTPAQDPQNVTREDLADALCPCLCAIPEFAEFCIPLLIEKLNSSLKIAKYDSINLLTESCKTFDVSIYEQHSHDIWNILQKETLNSSDPEIEEASLVAISAIINRLSSSENNSLFKQTVSNLYDSLKGNLRPDTKLFIPSSKILLAVARASKDSCNDIVQSTVALLINQYNLTKNSNHQEIILRTAMEFIVAYLKLFEVHNIMEVQVLKEVPALCIESTQHSETEIRAIGFESISRIAKTLPLEVREKIYELLKIEIVRYEPHSVRNALLKCFKTFSTIYNTEVLEQILSSKVNVDDIDLLQLYLEALCVIVSEKSFVDVVIPQILDYCTSDSIATSKCSVKCLRKLTEDNCDNDYIQEYLYVKCQVINRITNYILSIIKDNKSDLELLDDVSKIIKTIVGFQHKTEQEIIIDTHLNTLLDYYKTNEQMQGRIIIILEGFLLRARPEVEIPNKYELIREFLHVAASVDSETYLYASKLIANILNKCSEDEHFASMLNEIDTYVFTTLETSSNELHTKNIIQLISWVTKSLIIKGSNKSECWTDKLISLLDKYEDVGKSFKLIMDDGDECLSSISYCKNRLLYRQKFFAYVCKKLSSSYTENKPNHLIALGYLLQLAPQQVIILYFKETLRLLIFCLELCKDPEVLCAVLNTLSTLISTKEPYLENHIDDLIPMFLNLSKFETSMKVRIASLKCIEKIPNGYPVYKLLPHKQTVVFGLSAALDDKKRLVRRQAVDARSQWYLLDAPK